jgi:predicted nucleic acid-binding protein
MPWKGCGRFVGCCDRSRYTRQEYDDSVSTIVYLDLCCFKRPFDDGKDRRIRKEAEAVAEIMEMSESRLVDLVHSPAHDYENDRNPREDRRLAIRFWLKATTISVQESQETTDRARAIAALGFGTLDSLHLAFAEAASARWFITTDDQLLRTAGKHRSQLRVEVILPNPLAIEP